MRSAVRSVSDAYALGGVCRAAPLTAGSVQQNILLETPKGRFVLRLYGNRSRQSVELELQSLHELVECGFPCARPVERADQAHGGELLGPDRSGNPTALFEFVEGEHSATLTPAQQLSVIRAMAWLHSHTAGRERFHSPARANYTVDFCRDRIEAARAASRLQDRDRKAHWLLSRLERCELPDELPKGFCHCDYDSTNLLFDGAELKALLDFDDANYTWLILDIANALDYWYWPHDGRPELSRAVTILREYNRLRPLTFAERQHLFDAHRYQIILDAVWFFDRGRADEFSERRKLEYLDEIGVSEYRNRLDLA